MPTHLPLRLGVNIDHVATVRNARGGMFPHPLRAAQLAQSAHADSITVHLREDRRHILDADLEALMTTLAIPLNLEMATTGEMLGIALRTAPFAVCLVPERRAERTTEGGLDIASDIEMLRTFVRQLHAKVKRVAVFIDPHPTQIRAAHAIGADAVELHTGTFCEAFDAEPTSKATHTQLTLMDNGAHLAADLGLEVHAGHGLTYHNVAPIAKISPITELNIGHFLIGEAIFVGLEAAINQMRTLMMAARTSSTFS